MVIATLIGSSISVAYAESDPFPGIALGGEIGAHQILNAQGNPADGSAPLTCSAGSGSAIVANATTHETYAVCVKTWRPSAEVDADRAFQSAQESARAAAEAESISWNAAHPGQQKCVQWGPIVHANGVSTASGGVCANVVPLPAGSDSATTTTSTAPTETSTPVIATSAPLTESATPVASSTPIVSSSTAQSSVHSGLGGYAVVHPDGHVCGVIVGTSSDPFGNGGTMPVEYMGCPVGARIVFQSTPSADGNVAGWHGENVQLQGDTFVINNGPSSISVNAGVATDSSSGRSWDTGTGNVINPGLVDTRTALSDTRTVLADTATVISKLETTTVVAAQAPLIAPNPVSDSATAITSPDLDALPEVAAEEEAMNSVDAAVVNNKTRIEVATEWENTKLSVTASKKGSKKKYTYRFTTDETGNYLFKSSVNLKGFTLVLCKGTEELDRVVI